jgi:hypothetical protein
LFGGRGGESGAEVGEQPQTLEEHQRLIFANGEIYSEGEDDAGADLHAQARQTVERLAKRVRVLLESLVDVTKGGQRLGAAPFPFGPALDSPNGFENDPGGVYPVGWSLPSFGHG